MVRQPWHRIPIVEWGKKGTEKKRNLSANMKWLEQTTMTKGQGEKMVEKALKTYYCSLEKESEERLHCQTSGKQ